jgi:hypothetical protein
MVSYQDKELEILFKEEANKDRLNSIVNTKEPLTDLAGLVSMPDKTDSVQLKKEALNRR